VRPALIYDRFLANLLRFGLALRGEGSYLAPTQQRTCLWPSWLRNDVKRSGNRLVAGSFDRFVN
jgi:hypothetical protein